MDSIVKSITNKKNTSKISVINQSPAVKVFISLKEPQWLSIKIRLPHFTQVLNEREAR